MVSLTFKLAVCVASYDHKHHCLFLFIINRFIGLTVDSSDIHLLFLSLIKQMKLIMNDYTPTTDGVRITF